MDLVRGVVLPGEGVGGVLGGGGGPGGGLACGSGRVGGGQVAVERGGRVAVEGDVVDGQEEGVPLGVVVMEV
ncbi:hypothetical protein ADK45_22745 [Streptomyces rimosus subsp. rimosus]|nr:hypothetical protein ADK45_22745 [Streptomyces rimosus subsp. rimosus]